MLGLITIALGLFAAVFFLRDKFQLNTIGNLFLLLITYYALCVPLDILFGIQIHTNEKLLFLNYNMSSSHSTILWILMFYSVFALSFFITYKKTKSSTTQPTKFYEKICPHISTLVVINLSLFVFYFLGFYGVTRTNKVLLIQDSVYYRFINFLVPVLFCLNSYFICYAKKRQHAFWVMMIAIAGVLLTGGRTIVVYFALLYMVRFKPSLKLWQKISLVPAFLVFAIFFKGIYNNFLNLLKGYPMSPILSDQYIIGLSRIEGVMSFSIFGTLLKKYEFNSPMEIWSNFLNLLQIGLFRGAFSDPPRTMAEKYLEILAPEVAKEGGGIAFSGLVDVWLNLGITGFVVFGALFGFVFKKVDSNTKSLWMPFVLLVALRFLRSDFASMYKRFFVINGGVMIFIVCTLYLWRLYMENKIERTY